MSSTGGSSGAAGGAGSAYHRRRSSIRRARLRRHGGARHLPACSLQLRAMLPTSATASSRSTSSTAAARAPPTASTMARARRSARPKRRVPRRTRRRRPAPIRPSRPIPARQRRRGQRQASLRSRGGGRDLQVRDVRLHERQLSGRARHCGGCGQQRRSLSNLARELARSEIFRRARVSASVWLIVVLVAVSARRRVDRFARTAN